MGTARWSDGQLVAADGSAMMLDEKTHKQLTAAGKKAGIPQVVKPGEHYPATLDGGADSDLSGTPQPIQIWYGDPADSPHAYIVVQFEDGQVLVRDGQDKTGKALRFTNEEWAGYVGLDEKAKGKGKQEEAPANVTNPDELYKTDRGKNKLDPNA